MSKSRLVILAGLGILSTLLAVYLGYGYSRYPQMPLKCTTFTVYDLSRNNDHSLVLRLAQDLRLENRNSGYFLVKGNVLSQGNNTVLNRTLNLTDGDSVDSETFRYHIRNISKSSTDNTPDSLFNQWVDEITTQSGVLQLDVVRVKPGTWIIGSPVSFLFTCTLY